MFPNAPLHEFRDELRTPHELHLMSCDLGLLLEDPDGITRFGTPV